MPYEWVQLSIIFTYTVAANTTTRSTLLLAVSSSLDTLNQHFQETPTRSHKKLRNCVCFTERKSNHKVRFYDPLFLRWVFIYYMIYSEHIYRVFERLGVKINRWIGEIFWFKALIAKSRIYVVRSGDGKVNMRFSRREIYVKWRSLSLSCLAISLLYMLISFVT